MISNKSYIGLLVIFLVLIGCNKEIDQEKKCGSNSAITLSHINESGLRQLLLRSAKNQDSIFVTELVDLLDVIVSLTNDVIENNGGIDPSTGIISNGCKTGIALNKFYKKSNLSTLRLDLDKLKIKYAGSKESKIIELLIQVIEKDLEGDNSIILNSSDLLYSDIIMRLVLLQTKMYTLILDKYCID